MCRSWKAIRVHRVVRFAVVDKGERTLVSAEQGAPAQSSLRCAGCVGSRLGCTAPPDACNSRGADIKSSALAALASIMEMIIPVTDARPPLPWLREGAAQVPLKGLVAAISASGCLGLRVGNHR